MLSEEGCDVFDVCDERRGCIMIFEVAFCRCRKLLILRALGKSEPGVCRVSIKGALANSKAVRRSDHSTR